jgi:hypothetical protein
LVSTKPVYSLYQARTLAVLPPTVVPGPFAERGKKLAEDIYDGNEPAKVRRFSEAVLMLKHDPDLLPQILRSGLPSISPVLPEPQFKAVQREERSIFFFIGPERLLADAEKRLAVPKLVRLYPSDFWAE